MRKLVIAILLSAFASPAVADECGKVAYGRIATGYVYQDLGFVGSDKPVFQGGATLICGAWSYDLWTSYEFSGGTYGKRGYGDEVDFSVYYDRTVETSLGPVAFEGYAGYFVLSSFSVIKDDLAEVYADVGRPFKTGSITITPFVRALEWSGTSTKVFEPNTVLRPGLKFSIPIVESVALGGDVSHSFDLTTGLGTSRTQITLTKQFTNGWGLRGDVQFTEYARPIFAVGTSKAF